MTGNDAWNNGFIGIVIKFADNFFLTVWGNFGDDVVGNKNVNIAILPDLKKEYGIEFEHFDKRFLFKDEMWLVGSGRDTSIPNHIEVKDFATRPIISFSEKYPSFRMMVEKKLQEAGVNPVTVFESDNVGTLKRVIESGLGWGFLPAHSIRKQVKTNRMTQIEIEEVKYMVNVNLYSQKGSEIEPMVDVFYRALQQQGIK